MKIKRHYFYTFLKRVVSRTLGGENYVLAVFENKGRGKFVKLGERKGCTRGYKGFDSEAWSVVWDGESLGKLKNEIQNHPDNKGNDFNNYNSYYLWSFREKFGVIMESI